MTISAYRFLRKMKKAQRKPDGQIYIDFDRLEMKTIIEQGEPRTEVSIHAFKRSLYSILDYLKKEGLVTQLSLEGFQLTQSGYHYSQTLLSAAGRFLLASVLVPIIVAAITTLMTMWLTGSNSAPTP